MVARYQVVFTAPHPVTADAIAIHINVYINAHTRLFRPTAHRGAPPSTLPNATRLSSAHEAQGAAQVPSTSVRDSRVPNPIDGDPRSAPTVHIDARTHPMSGTDG